MSVSGNWIVVEGLNSIGLNIHRTHMTTNISTNNDVMFFFVSGLKIVHYNNY